MKIGIPRAFLYYKCNLLWKTFFEELDIDYIVSPETNKDILRQGINYGIDEACLSSKIYLGHVAWLLDKCDYILMPRISDNGDGTVCTKFEALYDVVANTFRNRTFRLLSYNIDSKAGDFELTSFLKMGKFLGKKKSQCLYAYLLGKYKQNRTHANELEKQNCLLKENKIKILLIAHCYNIRDKMIGEPILNFLEKLETVPIIADIAAKKIALAKAAEISGTLPWAFNKELVGSIPIYKDFVDGIILISSFPCGPDSLVNETLIRRIKDKPILSLIIDGQEGTAGMETRLESFIDIIRFKKDDFNAFN